MTARLRSKNGSAMVEMAVILPIFVLIIHGIFFFGQAYVYKEKMEMASRFAAWQKIIRPGDSTIGWDDPYHTPSMFDPSHVQELISKRFFNGEPVTVVNYDDADACKATMQPVEISGGGVVVDAITKVLEDLGGVSCSQVTYSFKQSLFTQMAVIDKDLFGPLEIKSTHIVMASYVTYHESGGLLDMLITEAENMFKMFEKVK